MVYLRVRSARMVRRGTAARSGSAEKRARRVKRMGSRRALGAVVVCRCREARAGGIGAVAGEEPEVEVGEGPEARDQGLEGVEALLFPGAPGGQGIGVEGGVGDGFEVDGADW